MEINSVRQALNEKATNTKNTLPEVLNPEALKKINYTFSKTHSYEGNTHDIYEPDIGCKVNDFK